MRPRLMSLMICGLVPVSKLPSGVLIVGMGSCAANAPKIMFRIVPANRAGGDYKAFINNTCRQAPAPLPL